MFYSTFFQGALLPYIESFELWLRAFKMFSWIWILVKIIDNSFSTICKAIKTIVNIYVLLKQFITLFAIKALLLAYQHSKLFRHSVQTRVSRNLWRSCQFKGVYDTKTFVVMQQFPLSCQEILLRHQNYRNI